MKFMANKTINVEATCPFFFTESAKSVTCEGIVGENTVTRFSYSADKITHEKTYCTCDYATCPIYIANMSKYW